MEEVQGPLLGVECELRVEPETFSFGVEREFGRGRDSLLRGWMRANWYVEFVTCLRHS